MNIFRLYREGFTLEDRNAGVVKPAQILVPVLSLVVTVQAGLAQVPVLTIDPGHPGLQHVRYHHRHFHNSLHFGRIN